MQLNQASRSEQSGREAAQPDGSLAPERSALAQARRGFGLKARMLWLVGIIITMATCATLAFWLARNSVEQALDKIVGGDVPRLNLAVQLSNQAQTVVAQVPILVRSPNHDTRAGARVRIEDELHQIEATLGRLHQSGAKPKAIATLSGFLAEIRSNAAQLDAIIVHRLDLEQAHQGAMQQVAQVRAHLHQALHRSNTSGQLAPWQLHAIELLAALSADSQLGSPQQLQAALDKIGQQANDLHCQEALCQEIVALSAGAHNPVRLKLQILRSNYLQETRLSVNNALTDRFIRAASQFGAETQDDVSATAKQLREQLMRHRLVSLLAFVAILGSMAGLIAYVNYYVVQPLVLIRNNIYAYLSQQKQPPIPDLGNHEIGDIGRALNFFVKLISERECALEAARDAAEAALEHLRNTQSHLVHTEKMASLGQLVANVAHEINTPIAAIKASGLNIADALELALSHLLRLFQVLDNDHQTLFVAMISHLHHAQEVRSTREERALVRALATQLEQQGVQEVRRKAEILVQLGVQEQVADYLPLLTHPQVNLIMDTGYHLAVIVSSTRNINIAVERVAKIIFALKSFSRSNQNKEWVMAHLRDGLETVLTIYQNQIKQSVTLVCQFDDIAPVSCLPDELNQVWTNLIHNALQAMNYQGTLTIRLFRDGNEAVVAIGDTGCGIPVEIREKIFEAFFTTKPIGEGSGLGLDIVKSIIDKHQGKIEIESEVGVGTTFLIRLPYPVALALSEVVRPGETQA
jgi:signal transduction histidine kinase